MTTAVRPRAEIPLESTWDTASVFPSDAEWEREIALVESQLPALAAFRGRLHEGPATIATWFSALEQTMGSVEKIVLYATMFYTVDVGNQDALARQARSVGIVARAQAAAAFAEPELLAISSQQLAEWTAHDERMKPLAHYFTSLAKRKEHIGSADVEALLSAVGEPFANAASIHAILADADLQFGHATAADGTQIPIAQGNINALLAAPDRETRRTAWQGYADAHLAVKNTMAACLSTGVKQNIFTAQARRYPSALDAALAETHIPSEVFHQLIKTFQANLPTWHRYWRLLRKTHGYDQLHVYDIKAPLAKKQIVVPYEQSIEWIAEGLKPLGPEYSAVMRRGMTSDRWVDIYPNKGKRMGAFSTGAVGARPFILMNYNDDIFSMSTLAHELGHSMHSYLAWGSQPYIYANYGIFVAEVASNFNQALVRDHLLRTNPDRDFQISLIEEAMNNFHRYFFVMPTLARFELEIHQRAERGEGLTAQSMIQLMADLFREGYGDEVVIDADRIGSTWCQFSTHLYANFYVYQYATGISAAHTLARHVLDGEPGAVDRYLTFLRSGSSLYPIDVLKRAGVDMLSPEPVNDAFNVLSHYVDRLEQLLG